MRSLRGEHDIASVVTMLQFRCKTMYFVSETDMLKAMRAALLDEVTRANEFIRGQNFTNLYNFLVLLSEVRLRFLPLHGCAV